MTGHFSPFLRDHQFCHNSRGHRRQDLAQTSRWGKPRFPFNLTQVSKCPSCGQNHADTIKMRNSFSQPSRKLQSYSKTDAIKQINTNQGRIRFREVAAQGFQKGKTVHVYVCQSPLGRKTSTSYSLIAEKYLCSRSRESLTLRVPESIFMVTEEWGWRMRLDVCVPQFICWVLMRRN